MRSSPELYAKDVLGTILAFRGQVFMEYETVVRRLRADMLFVPEPGRRGRVDLGIVERMADLGPCMLELFSSTPRARLGFQCLSKQQAHHDELCNEARRKHKAMPPRPHLWIISPGRPNTLINAMGLQPMEGWPPGFWRMVGEFQFHLIAIRDLPETPDTRLLRLLGNGKRLQRALAEISALPRNSPLRRNLVDLVVAWRDKMTDTAQEETMLLPESKALYAEWKKKVLDEGIEKGKKAGVQEGMKVGIKKGKKAGVQKGRKEGEQRLLRKQLTLRFGELPPDAERRIKHASMAKLELWGERVLTARSLDAVFAE